MPLLLTIVTVLTVMHRLLVSFGRRWGAMAHELAEPLPGDDLVPDADGQATMAIAIDAPPEQVWPWLVQMGVDRAGLYSLLWVENGILHLGVENADRIVPEWQALKVGDTVAFTPEGYPGGRHGPTVTAIEPNRALVLNMGGEPSASVGSWQFVLEPEEPGTTRLLMRSRSSAHRPVGLKVFDTVVEPGYLIMDIAMLRGIKERAERYQAA
jgi:uncharacterized protein YndB with AHSA1/START domain